MGETYRRSDTGFDFGKAGGLIVMRSGLSDEHRKELEKSGLTQKTMDEAGVYSVHRRNFEKELGRTMSARSLLAFPYPGTEFVRYKLFPPYMGKNGHTMKYYQPKGSPVHLYFPPGFKKNSTVIRITEGEKKALKGTQEGLNVCGLGGIWNFRKKDDEDHAQLISDFDLITWEGKDVEIIPDGDFKEKINVRQAVYRLGRILKSRGATVTVVDLPEDEKLDDYLCSHEVKNFRNLNRFLLTDPIFNDVALKEMSIDDVIAESLVEIGAFLKRDIPERTHIMKPWLKLGTIALVYAQRGVGKTWFCLYVALAVTRKLSIGRWDTETPTGCLYVDGEMSAAELQARINEMKKIMPNQIAPFFLLSADLLQRDGWRRPNLADKEWRTALYRLLERKKTIKLLILDNISSLAPGMDENTKHDWDDINQWLLSLRSLDVAVILVHHTGKGGDQRGTSAREDHLDVSIQLLKPKKHNPEDGAKFIVVFTKNRDFFGPSAAPLLIEVSREIDGLTLKTGKATNEQGTRTAIIALLGRGFGQKDIAGAVAVTPSYVAQIKKEAVERGILNRDKTFTPKGQEEYGDVDISEYLEPQEGQEEVN